jgi:hypothetical protein
MKKKTHTLSAVSRILHTERRQENSIAVIVNMWEGQTSPWTKEKGQKDKQRSTKLYTETLKIEQHEPH